MFSQWVFLSVLALAIPSFAWAEDAASDLGTEQSKAEQGDKRGDELFAEFTRLRQAAETGEPQALFDFGAYFYQQQNYASARMVGQGGRCGDGPRADPTGHALSRW